ncbi:MAG: FKBP-type peptidyl-prolyl cis-trans isomerase [Nocardioides sp.]|nr:FKBP-type peptidyl-prolyl cis-trans isomerase [Nocardioides sp.]
MLRPRLRAASLAGVLALSLALTSCGSDEADTEQGKDLDSVSIKGEVGKAPEVTFDGRLAAGEPEVEVLHEGEGEELEKGDTALAYWWIGNGFTEKEAVNAFEGPTTAIPVSDNTFPGLLAALEGHTVGSRVAVLASATEAFGEMGNPQLGIGNKDSALIIVDIMGVRLDGPQGTQQKPAAWAPAVDEKDGVVTGFDFKGVPRPEGKLRSTLLVKGDGPVVAKGQTIHVDYLGQVYRAAKPFDESYSEGKEPMAQAIGVGALVKGWDETLVGQTVGSRVIIEIPPKKGYGDAEKLPPGIKRDDTMYFVVDILAAA